MALHSRTRESGWALERLADDRDRFSKEQPLEVVLTYLQDTALAATITPPNT